MLTWLTNLRRGQEDGPAEPGTRPTFSIDVWYGPRQSFGHPGCPQRWVNLLGTADLPGRVRSLEYSLNGGPFLRLRVGPDGRRLAERGDFNLELDRADLLPGENRVELRASTSGGQTTQQVLFDYHPGELWPLPYSLTPWSSQLQAAVQVVDGRWILGEDGLRPAAPGYDRSVAVGGLQWQDVEVELKGVVHSIHPTRRPSNGAGLGLVMRWRGHTESPLPGRGPRNGWLPQGATVWIGWDTLSRPQGLALEGNQGPLARDPDFRLAPGTAFGLKARIETAPSGVSIYALKAWVRDRPEPMGWTLRAEGDPLSNPSGALLLIAHHAVVTFQDLKVWKVEQQV